MRYLLYLSLLITTTTIFAQDSFSEEDAKKVIDTFFEGFHEGDTVKMRSVMVRNLPTQTVFATKDGKNVVRDDSGEEF